MPALFKRSDSNSKIHFWEHISEKGFVLLTIYPLWAEFIEYIGKCQISCEAIVPHAIIWKRKSLFEIVFLNEFAYLNQNCEIWQDFRYWKKIIRRNYTIYQSSMKQNPLPLVKSQTRVPLLVLPGNDLSRRFPYGWKHPLSSFPIASIR